VNIRIIDRAIGTAAASLPRSRPSRRYGHRHRRDGHDLSVHTAEIENSSIGSSGADEPTTMASFDPVVTTADVFLQLVATELSESSNVAPTANSML
jgi:hypothetical protein